MNIFLVFITQSYFSVSKEVRLNSTHYLIMKIHNRRESQHIAIDHSADIDYKDFLKIYRNSTKERQLEAIRDFSATNRSKEIEFSGKKNEKQKALTKEIKEINRKNSNKNFTMVHSNRTLYDFNKFRDLNQFVFDIYNGVITIRDAEKEQTELASEIRDLIDYGVRSQKKDEQKQEVLRNVRQLLEIRNKIIDAFQNGIFPPPKNAQEKQTKEEEKQTKEEEKQTEEKAIPDWVKVSNYTFKKIEEDVEEYVKKGWFSKAEGRKFKMNRVKSFLEDIVDKKFDNAEEARIWYVNNIFDQEKKIKRTENKTSRNIDIINLHDSVKKNFVAPNYDKKDDEQPDTTYMPELESEESPAQRREHEGKGLKIFINSTTNA